MLYTIGDHVDLSYLNKSVVDNPEPKPGVFAQAVESGLAVGTQIMFRLENNKITSGQRVIHIPVMVA